MKRERELMKVEESVCVREREKNCLFYNTKIYVNTVLLNNGITSPNRPDGVMMRLLPKSLYLMYVKMFGTVRQ